MTYYVPDEQKLRMEKQRKKRKREDMWYKVAFVFIFIIFFGGIYSCDVIVRNNAIKDCKAQGGTAIVPSWISHDPWDVKCIEK